MMAGHVVIPRHQEFKIRCGSTTVNVVCLRSLGSDSRSVTIDGSEDMENKFHLESHLYRSPTPGEDLFAVTSFDMFWSTVYPEGCWEWVVDQDEITVALAVLRVADQWIKGRRPKGYIGK